MIKILKKILLLTLPFGLIIMLTNYFVDAGNIFGRTSYETKIANTLLQKKNAMGIDNFDDRLVVEHIVKNIDTLPQAVVIGTSRALILQQKNFDSVNFRNLAMVQSNINDLVAEIGLFDYFNKFPKTLYIEVLPLYKSNGIDGTKWWTLSKYHKHIIEKISLKKATAINNPNLFFLKRKLDALISIDYFQKNIESFKKVIKRKIIVVDDENKMYEKGRYWDGSVCYDKNQRNVDTLKVMGNVEIFIKNESSPKADENKMAILQQLINYLKTKKVVVKLLIMPYQIDTYKAYQRNNSLTIFQNKVVDFAKNNNVDLIGSFNPEELNIGREYFYDPAHCSPEKASNILQKIQYSANH